MKINKIELKGFGSYRDYNEQEIPDGITGIIGTYDGNERRSNGSGKSTLVMAIIYAFYGEGEFTKLEEIVNDSMPDDDMYVKVYFKHNGQDYLVVRGIKKKSSYLDFFQDFEGKNKLTKTKITLTQVEIDNIIGMNYNMFTASVFFEQDNMDKFINTTPEKCRSYVDKFLELEIWRTARKAVVKDKNAAEKEKVALMENIFNNNEKVKSLKLSLTEKTIVETQLNEYVVKQKEVQSLIDKFSLQMMVLDQLNKVKNLKTVAGDKLDQLNSSMFIEKNHLEKNQLGLSSIEAEIASVGKPEDFDNTELNLYKKESLDYEVKIKNLENLLQQTNITIATCNTNITNLRDSAGNMVEGICPTCLQNVDVEHLKKEGVRISEKISKYEEELVIASNSRKETQDDILTFNNKKISSEGSIRTIEVLLDNVKKNLDALLNKKNLKEKDVANAALVIKNIEEKKVQLSEEIERCDKEIGELKVKSPDLVPNLDINKCKGELLVINENITQYNKRLGELSQIEKNVAEFENELISLETTLKNLESKISIYNVLAESFQEIPRQIFEKSIGIIQDAANEIIQQVLPNVTVKIYEDDSVTKRLIIAFEVSGKDRGYKRLSGGERVVVNIGLRLGFSKVIRTRTRTNIGFVALDEPFGMLDGHNKDLIQKVITLILEWFNQIVVISHVDNVQDFPNVITVHKTVEDVSYII